MNIYRTLSVMLLGAAASLMPVSASAQNYKGSFELPYDVSWNGYNFAAGHYQIWTQTELSGAPFVHLQGPNGGATLQYAAHDNVVAEGNGKLILKQVDGGWAVEEFRTGESGKVYAFRVPKPRHAEIASTTGAAPREAIISIAGGQ
ncbi:MAG TPA: hypothetical protein VFA04_03635 [Bryobacteraceae bacterium]|nr:hypothetical protein [Bryobacteraceae bacterium]